MTLTAVDWTVIVLYFVLSVAIALLYSRRAGASADEYFLSAARSLVARGDLDGRDYVRRRHATRRDGAHRQVRIAGTGSGGAW